MAPHITCCLCGRTLQGVRPFFVHLAEAHQAEGFRLRAVTFVCACGYGYSMPADDWDSGPGGYTAADHLWQRGGLRNHLFALLLGEEDYSQYQRYLNGGRQLP